MVTQSEAERGHTAAPRPIANCDQEDWVKKRILTAIRMAIVVRMERRVAAEDGMYNCAISGIVNGAAVEIIQTLGMEPEYTNLTRPQYDQPPLGLLDSRPGPSEG